MKKFTLFSIIFCVMNVIVAHNSPPVSFTKTNSVFLASTPFSVSPSSANAGQSIAVTFTSNGTLFGMSTSCLHLDTSNIILTNSNYSGISIHSSYFYLLDTLHMVAHFNIPASLTTGSYDILVGQSCVLALNNGFSINPAISGNDFSVAYYPTPPTTGTTLNVTLTDFQNRFFK